MKRDFRGVNERNEIGEEGINDMRLGKTEMIGPRLGRKERNDSRHCLKRHKLIEWLRNKI